MAQRPRRPRLILDHLYFIGNRSIGIILLTAGFTGMVLMLQSHHALSRFGSELYLGPLVALSLIRELGPVLGALLVTARVGSAVAATIASMRVSEQIDALETMSVDPIPYLASTRLVAALVAVPLLTAIFDLAGIGAAHALGVAVLRIDGGTFISSVKEAVEWSDVSAGLWKSLLFAVLIAWVACYRGFVAIGGAAGIGQATTRAVVTTSVLVLVGDYVMTALLF